MMFECQKCGKSTHTIQAPCPDKDFKGRCLTVHHDANSYKCEHCGHDNIEWVLSRMRGPRREEIGIGYGNIAAIAKLDLSGVVEANSVKDAVTDSRGEILFIPPVEIYRAGYEDDGVE